MKDDEKTTHLFVDGDQMAASIVKHTSVWCDVMKALRLLDDKSSMTLNADIYIGMHEINIELIVFFSSFISYVQTKNCNSFDVRSVNEEMETDVAV